MRTRGSTGWPWSGRPLPGGRRSEPTIPARPAPRPFAAGVLAVAAVLAIALGGCGTSSQTAEGIVVQVTSSKPLTVDSFVLRTADGRQMTFTIGTLQVDAGSFDPPHLRVHQLTAEPIVVEYHDVDGRHVATRLSDGPSPSS